MDVGALMCLVLFYFVVLAVALRALVGAWMSCHGAFLLVLLFVAWTPPQEDNALTPGQCPIRLGPVPVGVRLFVRLFVCS